MTAELDPTRRRQRLVLGLGIVLAVLGSLFLGAAAVVIWATRSFGSRP